MSLPNFQLKQSPLSKFCFIKIIKIKNKNKKLPEKLHCTPFVTKMIKKNSLIKFRKNKIKTIQTKSEKHKKRKKKKANYLVVGRCVLSPRFNQFESYPSV